MKHIRYLSDNRTVCVKPSRLGHDCVTIDTSRNLSEPSCRVCSDLLFAHNLEEYENEQRGTVMYVTSEVHPLSPSREALIPILILVFVAIAVGLGLLLLSGV